MFRVDVANPADLSIQSVELSEPFRSLDGSGESPVSGVALDAQGNAYGIDYGSSGIGVFKLTELGEAGSSGGGETGPLTGNSGETGNSNETPQQAIAVLDHLTSEIKEWTNAIDHSEKQLRAATARISGLDNKKAKDNQSDLTKLNAALASYNAEFAADGLQLREYGADEQIAEAGATAAQADVASEKLSHQEQKAFDKALHQDILDAADHVFKAAAKTMAVELASSQTKSNDSRS